MVMVDRIMSVLQGLDFFKNEIYIDRLQKVVKMYTWYQRKNGERKNQNQNGNREYCLQVQRD